MNFTNGLSLIRKFKFLLLGSLCLILLSTHAPLSQYQAEEEIPLEYSVQIPKVDLKTQKLLEGLPSDSAIAVWVFFKDKGIKSSAQYKRALDECVYQLSERSLRRRMQRGQTPWVDFTDIPVKRQYLNELENLGAKIRVVSRWLNAASVLANKQQIEKVKSLSFVRAVKKVVTFTRKKPSVEEKQFKKLGNVGAIHELPLQQVLGYGKSYAQLQQIHVPELHNLGFSGKGVLIILLDTGFFIHHPAFEHILSSGKLVATHDFINGDDDVDDQDNDQRWHGTAVWSVVGGYFADSLVGSAYGAQFALAKTERVDSEVVAEEDNWVAGIKWADSLGADIVSSSLGYTDWYTYEDMDGNAALCTQMADLAVSKGMVVVNAAGNERDDPWYYIIAPADGDSVIAVGAVDLQGELTSFSSAGPTYDGRIKPDVLACGYRTFCASSSGGYTTMSGTSLSTPLVAGSCALLLEANPDWGPIQIREALWRTASRADHPDNLMGYGIVNAAKASGFSLVVSPQELYFKASFGETQSQDTTLSITNWQGEGLKWEAYTTAEWISLFPNSGFTPDLIQVTVIPTGLSAGINRGLVVISAEDTINSSQTVPVVMTLFPGVQVRAFPNPFTDSLTVIVEKPKTSSKIKVSVFTVAGELVYRFPEKDGQEIYQQTWDGKNEQGREVGSGVYLLKVDIGHQSQIVKVAKVK